MGNGSPKSVARLYSVPRRFDLATMMVVTLAYALLLGALRLLQLPPLAVVKVAGFFTCVAIAQALLFRGKKPRLSSVLVGVVYIVGLYVSDAMTRNPSLLEFHVFILLIWLFIAVAGAFCGYAAGIAVGSVFLLSDVIRKSIQRRKHA